MLAPRLTLALLALLALASVGAAAETDWDFAIDVHPGGPGVVSEGAELVGDEVLEEGARASWNLSLVEDYSVGIVRFHGWFDVARERQAVPLLDGRHFGVLHDADVANVTEHVRLVNVTREGDVLVLRLGVPGPGNATLAVERDVEAPTFSFEPVSNVAHRSFIARTTTSEPALADLRVAPVGGGREIAFPTVEPAFQQTFPVQGLEPDTEYVFHVTFRDWSGNAVTSEGVRVRTLPEPERPEPTILDLVPARDATLAAPPLVVGARVESPESPVGPDGARLFVDKREVPRDAFRFDGDVLTYAPPQPLAAGVHSVGVEVMNAAGGKAVASWKFTVAGANEVAADGAARAAAPAAAVAALAVAAAALLSRRR